MNDAQRFLAKVDRSGGPDACWVWTGAIDRTGYGRFKVNGKAILTHRAAWSLDGGALPANMVLDHLCRNRACCNPKHLELVTYRENAKRGANGDLKETCAYGHQWTAESTRSNGAGRRQCTVCANERWRRWRDRNREKEAS